MCSCLLCVVPAITCCTACNGPWTRLPCTTVRSQEGRTRSEIPRQGNIAVPMLTCNCHTFVKGDTDKRMVTATPVVSRSGQLVSMQVIWKGKSERTIPPHRGHPIIMHDYAKCKMQNTITFQKFLRHLSQVHHDKYVPIGRLNFSLPILFSLTDCRSGICQWGTHASSLWTMLVPTRRTFFKKWSPASTCSGVWNTRIFMLFLAYPVCVQLSSFPLIFSFFTQGCHTCPILGIKNYIWY